MHPDERAIQTVRNVDTPRGRGREGGVTARGPLLAWMIALVLIGHSVLMLGAAHATSAPRQGEAHAHQTVRDDVATAQGPVALAMANEQPAQHRSDRCDVVFPAAPRRDDAPPETVTVALGTSYEPLAATITALIVPTDVPIQPPSVRRALLQVYRI